MIGALGRRGYYGILSKRLAPKFWWRRQNLEVRASAVSKIDKARKFFLGKKIVRILLYGNWYMLLNLTNYVKNILYYCGK